MTEKRMKAKTRRKRAKDLIPVVRHQLPILFDHSEDYASLAKNIGIPPMDLIAEVVRSMRRGPQRETANVIPLVRRAG